MKELCPVCSTEYPQNVPRCDVCGFIDEFGINRIWPIAEDAKKWLNEVVKPYRIKWHSLTNENNTPQLIANDYYIIGLVHYRNNDYDRAIADFTKAIEINPNYSNAYAYRGVAYRSKENYNQAISDYTKAITIDPNDACKYKARGTAYYEKGCTLVEPNDISNAIGSFEQAITDFTKAIAIDPKDAKSYSSRGIAYNMLKKDNLAMIDFAKAIEIDTNCEDAYLNRGMIYYFLKKHDLALVDFAKAVGITSVLPDAFKNMVRNMLIDRYNLGMTAYNKACKKFFGSKVELFLEAINYFTQGINSAEAIPGILSPEELAMYYHMRAESYTANVGPFAPSHVKADYEKARQLDPSIGKKGGKK